MPNRSEIQNKGPGSRKHPTTGEPFAPSGTVSHRGISGVIRLNKHTEAKARNARTPHNRTKAHRLDRCITPGAKLYRSEHPSSMGYDWRALAPEQRSEYEDRARKVAQAMNDPRDLASD